MTRTLVSQPDRRKPRPEQARRVEVRSARPQWHVSKLTGPFGSHVKVRHPSSVSSARLQRILDALPAETLLSDVEAVLAREGSSFAEWEDGTPGHQDLYRTNLIPKAPRSAPKRRWRRSEKVALGVLGLGAGGLLLAGVLGAAR